MALGVTRSLLADGATLRSMVWVLLALVTFCMSLTFADTESQCKFPNHQKTPDLSVLKPLMGKRFVVEDASEKYTYHLGICTTAVADPAKNISETGILQLDNKNGNAPHNIGKFVSSEIRIGTDWAMLEYRNGDPYHHHCKNAARVAVIMITCDPLVKAISEVKVILIAEENEKSAECYYLFELSHSCMCTDMTKPVFSLSIGSIVVIVFISLCGVYLLGGVLYNRFVLGAKGMEQIPNYNFWQDFGNLQADGCNLICRTRTASRSYKGIGDDQLAEAEDDRDDHLLPM